MEMTIRKQIGKEIISFKVEGATFWDCQMEAQKLSFYNIHKCGLCECDNVYLRAYKTKEKGYKYISIQCPKCRAKLTFGQRQDDGSIYLRKNDDGSLAWEAQEQKDNTKTIAWEE